MKIQLGHSLQQRPMLVGNMQQSIEMLQLPLAELAQTIDQELQENPLLEADEVSNTESLDNLVHEPLLQVGNDGYSYHESFHQDVGKSEEKPLIKIPSLEDHLLRQLKLEVNDSFSLKVGEFIISHLNEDGYLTCSVEEIAASLGISDVEKIEEVLSIIQHFEPLAIASRNIQECLAIQIHQRFNGKGGLLIKLVTNHLEDLSHKRFQEIAKKLSVSVDEAKALVQQIAGLEPKPARNFRPLKGNIYVKPDVIISQNSDDQYQITINKEYIPTLRINKTYQKLLSDPNRNLEEKRFISEKIKNALNFIKSIEQRDSTLRQIADYILKYQREFFDNGPLHLKPMILKDIAQFIDRNESTVSRAISDKYIETPHGTFPMKYFFSSAISDKNSGNIASRSVKEEIKTMIENEDSKKPLSDQDIYQHLANRGTSLSRRTVTKYRQALKILPSHLRKV